MFEPSPQYLKALPQPSTIQKDGPVAAALVRARVFLTDVNNWCQGKAYYAPTGAFCAIGAIQRAEGWSLNELSVFAGSDLSSVKFLRSAAHKLYDTIPIVVNDFHGHAATLAMFDAAILAARAVGE